VAEDVTEKSQSAQENEAAAEANAEAPAAVADKINAEAPAAVADKINAEAPAAVADETNAETPAAADKANGTETQARTDAAVDTQAQADAGSADSLEANTEAPQNTEAASSGAGGNEEVVPLPDFSGMLAEAAKSSIDILNDVDLNVKIELGRANLTVEHILNLSNGSVIELDKLAGDPVDILVNEQLIARGEVLVINDNFCVRINEIIPGISERVMQNQ